MLLRIILTLNVRCLARFDIAAASKWRIPSTNYEAGSATAIHFQFCSRRVLPPDDCGAAGCWCRPCIDRWGHGVHARQNKIPLLFFFVIYSTESVQVCVINRPCSLELEGSMAQNLQIYLCEYILAAASGCVGWCCTKACTPIFYCSEETWNTEQDGFLCWLIARNYQGCLAYSSTALPLPIQ